MAEHFRNEDFGDESLTSCRGAISKSTALNCFQRVQMAEQKRRAGKQRVSYWETGQKSQLIRDHNARRQMSKDL